MTEGSLRALAQLCACVYLKVLLPRPQVSGQDSFSGSFLIMLTTHTEQCCMTTHTEEMAHSGGDSSHLGMASLAQLCPCPSHGGALQGACLLPGLFLSWGVHGAVHGWI